MAFQDYQNYCKDLKCYRFIVIGILLFLLLISKCVWNWKFVPVWRFTKYGSNQLRYGKISDNLTLTFLRPALILMASFNLRFSQSYWFLKFQIAFQLPFLKARKWLLINKRVYFTRVRLSCLIRV